MSPKITPDHLARAAVVYLRQSTLAQVLGNLESQRRQYALADAAKAAGFAAVATIDDDLGRSGSGLVIRPGFQKLVAAVRDGSAPSTASKPPGSLATGAIGTTSSTCALSLAPSSSISTASTIRAISTTASCWG